MIELHNYLPAHFERLWEIDQTCFSADIAYSRRELEHYLRFPDAICILALDTEQIQGFIVGHEYRKHTGHIVTLDVLPSARLRGIGSALIDALEQRFRATQCRSILLEVAVNNFSAMVFYKKCGYSVVKTLRRYYPGGVDGLLMSKILA